MCKDCKMADQALPDAGWSQQVHSLFDIASISDGDLPKYLMVHRDFHDDWCGLHLVQGDLLEVFGFQTVACVCGEYDAGDGSRQVFIPLSYDGKVKKVSRCEYQFPLVKDLVRHFPKYVKVTHNAKPQERLLGLNEIVELVKADEHFLYVKKNGSDFQLPLTYKGDFEEVIFPDSKEYTLEEIINRCMFPIWVKMTEVKRIREGFTRFTHFSGEVKLNYVMEERLLLCRVVKDDELQEREGQHTDVMCIPVDFICRQSSPVFKVPTGILRHSRRQFSAKPDWDLSRLNTAVDALNFVTTHRATLHPRKPSVTDDINEWLTTTAVPAAVSSGGIMQKPVPPPRRGKKPVDRATVSGGEVLAEVSHDQDSDDLRRKKPGSLSELDRFSIDGAFDNNFDLVETWKGTQENGSKESEKEHSEGDEVVMETTVPVMQQSSIPEDPPPSPPVSEVPVNPVKSPPPVSPRQKVVLETTTVSVMQQSSIPEDPPPSPPVSELSVSPVKPPPPVSPRPKVPPLPKSPNGVARRPPDLPPRPISPLVSGKSATLPNTRSGQSPCKAPPARPPHSPRLANKPLPKDTSHLQQLVPVQVSATGGPQGYLDMTRGNGSFTEPSPSLNYFNENPTHPKPPPLEPPSDSPHIAQALRGPNPQLARKAWLSTDVPVEPAEHDSNYATMDSDSTAIQDNYFTFTTPVLANSPKRVPPALPPRPKGSLSSTPNSPCMKDQSSVPSPDCRDRGSVSSSSSHLTCSSSTSDNDALADRNIDSVADISQIPEDLHKLGVKGLADALRLIKLEKLADTCRENLIDGKMFLELTEQDLKDEPFSLSSFHLKKALMFKDKGWVPNMN